MVKTGKEVFFLNLMRGYEENITKQMESKINEGHDINDKSKWLKDSTNFLNLVLIRKQLLHMIRI